MLEADNLPVNVNPKANIPVIKKTTEAIRLLKVTVPIIGLLKIAIPDIFPERKTDIIRSGATIPSTYIPPTSKAPKKLGDRKVKAIIPIKTGAQQAEVIPEKIPKMKMDKISV